MSLATEVASMTTRRDALVAELAALDVNGPDISLDGVSIGVMEYGAKLMEQINKLTDMIERFSGPCVALSLGR